MNIEQIIKYVVWGVLFAALLLGIYNLFGGLGVI